MPAKKTSRVKSRANSRTSVNRTSGKQSAKRRKRQNQSSASRPPRVRSVPLDELWIAPRTSLSRPEVEAPWRSDPLKSNDARLLELADIALGLRKPQAFRRRRSAFLHSQSAHSTLTNSKDDAGDSTR